MAVVINVDGFDINFPSSIDKRLIVDTVDGSFPSLTTLDTGYNYDNMIVWVRDEKAFYHLVDGYDPVTNRIGDEPQHWVRFSGGATGCAKSGYVPGTSFTGDGPATASVTFDTPYQSASYSVAVTQEGFGETVVYVYTVVDKSPSGFVILVDGGNSPLGATAMWITNCWDGSGLFNGGGGGGASVAIDIEEIAFGTGTGITSSNAFTFDQSNTNLILGLTNTVTDSFFSTILGSSCNTIATTSNSSIIGGYYNTVSNSTGTIINSIGTYVNYSYYSSVISTNIFSGIANSTFSVMIGSKTDKINNSLQSLSLGSSTTKIDNSNSSSIIVSRNSCMTASCHSTILSSSGSCISDSTLSVIIGGPLHRISESMNSTINGGHLNIIDNTLNSNIIGGFKNCIFETSNNSSIISSCGSGLTNSANNSAIISSRQSYNSSGDYSTIISGRSNKIVRGGNPASSGNSLAMFGYKNCIYGGSRQSGILGGECNFMTQSCNSIILGGCKLGMDSINNMVYVPSIRGFASVQFDLVTSSTNYVLNQDNFTLIAYPTTSGMTVSLPTAASSPHRLYVIKKNGSSTQSVVYISPNGSDTIDGYSDSIELINPWDYNILQSDGVNLWIKLGGAVGLNL